MSETAEAPPICYIQTDFKAFEAGIPWHVATCICGWKGTEHFDLLVACTEALDHQVAKHPKHLSALKRCVHSNRNVAERPRQVARSQQVHVARNEESALALKP